MSASTKPVDPDSGELGILGYADPWSVAPGQELRCMVSCEPGDFDVEIIRLMRGGPRAPDEESADKWPAVKTEVDGRYSGQRQPLSPGSYFWADLPDGAIDHSRFLSFVAWVWPTRETRGLQGLVGLGGAGAAVGLGVSEDGCAAFFARTAVGEPSVVQISSPLVQRRWYLLGATLDWETGGVEVFQVPEHAYPHSGEAAARNSGTVSTDNLRPVDRCLVGAAWADAEKVSGDGTRRLVLGCFDGKVERPQVVAGQLTTDVLAAVHAGGELPGHLAGSCIADWDLSVAMPTTLVCDRSGHGYHGRTVNSPTRAVTGHRWTGSHLDWRQVPEEYAALHFHSDDIDDACWEPAFRFVIPEDFSSGAYGVRLSDSTSHFIVPFFVRPAPDAEKARTCVLLPTWTYMAYSNFESSAVDAEAVTGNQAVRDPVDSVIDAHPELGWSLYNHHSDGSGIAYVTRRRPMLDMQPHHRFWLSGGGGWAVSGDMYLIDWLNAIGAPFDIITDDDLHQEGVAALAEYSVVITGSHPEYVSGSILDALQTYTERGGHLMYLGGNGFYWVTDALPDRSHVIEIRRGHAGTRTWEGMPGEGHLSATGEPGGLWRHRGRAPQALVGVGFCAQGGGGSSPYRQQTQTRDPRVAFAFDGVGPDEVIGDFGNNMGGAAGDEIDRVDFALGTPSHTLVVASSAGLQSDNYLHVVEEVPVMVRDVGGVTCSDVRADMTFFETMEGGAVFSVGSIDWSASLSAYGYDNNVSRITLNVLQAFGGGPETPRDANG